ncbi:MAG: FadR family transcriptional regulator [Rhodobacteraceae bacterium]|nr:FadR family transcriptional regulator [Paracoccaceae bacterium]
MESPKQIFEPIAHDSVADAVIDQIEDLIVTGVLKEGRKLPSERELAELLDVSRPKLREALKALEERGLIEVRHGEGSFIAPLIGKALSPALMDIYARHPVAFYDYLEYRREQEGFAARLAAIRATQADKDVIAAILSDMDAAHETHDALAAQRADIALHTAIVDVSHNTTLIHMMASIYDLTRRGVFYNRGFLRTLDGTGEKLLSQHHQIASAVLNGDTEAAEAAARAHIDFVENSFRIGQASAKRENISRKRLMLSRLQ